MVVLLILLLILGNTMAMATRERTVEYAVLRAIGFKPGHVVAMVIGEGIVIASLGIALAFGMAPSILRGAGQGFAAIMGGFLGDFAIDPIAAVWAIAVALAGGTLAAAIPAWRAGRMRLVDALRRVE
jgi:putative ABC transport system permease protein